MRQQGNGAIKEFNERVEIAAIRESLSLANVPFAVFGLVELGVSCNLTAPGRYELQTCAKIRRRLR